MRLGNQQILSNMYESCRCHYIGIGFIFSGNVQPLSDFTVPPQTVDILYKFVCLPQLYHAFLDVVLIRLCSSC